MHFRAQIAHAHEMRFSFFHSVTKELKQAPFLSHRRKAKVNVSHAGAVVSPRFPN